MNALCWLLLSVTPSAGRWTYLYRPNLGLDTGTLKKIELMDIVHNVDYLSALINNVYCMIQVS